MEDGKEAAEGSRQTHSERMSRVETGQKTRAKHPVANASGCHGS